MCLLEWIRFNASLDDTVKSWTNKATSHTWFPTVRLTAKCTATTKMAFSTGTVHCPSTRTRTGQPTCTACSSSRLHSTHKACLPSHRAFPAARPETNSDRCARALISTDLAARLRERLRYGGIVGPCSYWPLPLPLPPQATPFSLFFFYFWHYMRVCLHNEPHTGCYLINISSRTTGFCVATVHEQLFYVSIQKDQTRWPSLTKE